MWLIVAALATWRLTAFVLYDEGPFSLCVRVRAVMVRIKLAGLLACFHCASVWVALLVVLVTYEVSWPTVLVWWAIAGASSALELLVGGPIQRSDEIGQTDSVDQEDEP